MSSLAATRKWNREHYPCKIKGCGFTSYRGPLCRKHWEMIPLNDRIGAIVEGMAASHRIAQKNHRRFLRELQRRLA